MIKISKLDLVLYVINVIAFTYSFVNQLMHEQYITMLWIFLAFWWMTAYFWAISLKNKE